MTDLASRLNFPMQAAPHKPARPILMLSADLFGGLALGVIARAWMRLISDDPEFTWNGTIFIVGGFTVFGFTQSVGRCSRSCGIPGHGRPIRHHRQRHTVHVHCTGRRWRLKRWVTITMFVTMGLLLLQLTVGFILR